MILCNLPEREGPWTVYHTSIKKLYNNVFFWGCSSIYLPLSYPFFLDLSNSCDSAKSSETQPGDKRSASVITSTSAANSLAAAQSSAAASVASSSTTDVPMDVASNSGNGHFFESLQF